MDRLMCIEAFVRVAETNSFAEAARQLGIANSVVTNRVQQLERYVDAPLFHRTTRHVRLSEVGESFYGSCRDMVAGVDALTEQMRQSRGRQVGKLRLKMLPGYAVRHFGEHLAEFTRRYPELEVDVTVSDRLGDPTEEGFDVAFQIFPPASESLVRRQLFPVRRLFCASPDYLKRHRSPKHPREFLEHTVGVYSGYPTRNRWTFHRGTKSFTMNLTGSVRSNSVHLLHDFAVSGGGIVCLPTLVASESLLSGELVPLLSEHTLSSYSFLAIYSSTQRRSLKVKSLIDFLAAKFGDDPPWDAPLRKRGWLK